MQKQKKYEIIYADPPWSYYNDLTCKKNPTTVPENGHRMPPYPMLSSKDIRSINVQNISEKNCFLFIWTTDYHLDKCLKVIEDWGFTYKTVAFSWQKFNKQGDPVCFTGAYTLKSGIENCLLATKGNIKGWVQDKTVRALIQSQRTEHSQKPEEARKRIERLLGDRPRVELFAREKHKGWDTIGNEIDGENIFDIVGRRE